MDHYSKSDLASVDAASLNLPAAADSTAKQSRHDLIRKTQTDLDISGDYSLISEQKQPNKWRHRSVTWKALRVNGRGPAEKPVRQCSTGLRFPQGIKQRWPQTADFSTL